MEEITNEMILKRLGWTVVESPIEIIPDTPMIDILAPDGLRYGPFVNEQQAWNVAATWNKIPDYINDLNTAITLTMPNHDLELHHVDSEWEASYVLLPRTYDSSYFIAKTSSVEYDDSPARAICKAWLAAMDAIEGGAE